MATYSSFLPGASHGQRSLAGCSPEGHKQSYTTKPVADTLEKWTGGPALGGLCSEGTRAPFQGAPVSIFTQKVSRGVLGTSLRFRIPAP